MKNRSNLYVAVLVSAFAVQSVPALSSEGACEIPFRTYGHLIVVEASLGDQNGLTFIIDTGATHTVSMVDVEPRTDESRTDESRTGESRTDEPETDEWRTDEPGEGDSAPGIHHVKGAASADPLMTDEIRDDARE